VHILCVCVLLLPNVFADISEKSSGLILIHIVSNLLNRRQLIEYH